MTDVFDSAADPLRAWREAAGGTASTDEAGAATRRRPNRLLLAAGFACAAAVTLAATSAARVAPTTPASAPVPVGPITPSAYPPASTASGAVAPPDAAAAAAVIAVRAAAPKSHYVDTAAAETVTETHGVTLVTVRAFVLYRRGRGWDAGRVARYAVPLDAGADPVVLAAPWRLPDPRTVAADGQWKPAPQPDLVAAAERSLGVAGYRVAGDVEVRVDGSGRLAAVFVGGAPGEAHDREHTVWLTSDAAAVLGAPEPAADLPVPRP